MNKERVFIGSTQAEANRKADEWWSPQKGLRLVQRTQVAVGEEGPELAKAKRWAVTIHFEGEDSN
jgi:hypothetical protein